MTPTQKTVKGRQVKRYYGLLVRLGFAAVFDAMNQAASAPAPLPVGPTPAGGMAPPEAPEAVETPVQVTLDLDFGKVFRACAGADADGGLSALDELAAAVLDLDDDTAAAGEWDAGEVAERYPLFVEGCGALLKLLMQPRFGQE